MYERRPYKGVPETLRQMQVLAAEGQTSQKIREWAEARVRGLVPNDQLSEAAAIAYGIHQQVRYTQDPVNAEMVRHPALTVMRGAGDCDDMATAIRAAVGALAQSLGVDCDYIAVAINSNEPEHVLCRAKIGGHWVILDPVAGPAAAAMLTKIRGAVKA